MVKEFLVQLFFDILKVFASMLLSVFALYQGMKLLDRLTIGIEEWEEIKKGNIAVGMLYAAVILSIVMLSSTTIEQFVFFLSPSSNIARSLILLMLSLLLYVLNLLASIIIIYLTFTLVDKLTVDVEEIKELKKGNVAVALILSIIIIAVAFIVRTPLSDVFSLSRVMALLGM